MLLEGIRSVEDFIDDTYGPATELFRIQLDEFDNLLSAVNMEAYSTEEWMEFKEDVFLGIEKLYNLAREFKKISSGALRNKVEVNSNMWQDVKKDLDMLERKTKKTITKFKQIYQEQQGQIPVWAACMITGLTVALVFTIVIAIGIYRQSKKASHRMISRAGSAVSDTAIPVTQRDSVTDRQGTNVDAAAAIKKMNEMP